MDGKHFLLLAALVAVVLVSGCTEPLDRETKTAIASAEAWLESSGEFPGGSITEPIKVWRDGKALYWIIPIEENEQYIGNLIANNANFSLPSQVIKYSEPRGRLLDSTREEAYQQMISESDYPAYQIERPILVALEESGLHWYSQVKSEGQVLDEIYLGTFTIF